MTVELFFVIVLGWIYSYYYETGRYMLFLSLFKFSKPSGTVRIRIEAAFHKADPYPKHSI